MRGGVERDSTICHVVVSQWGTDLQDYTLHLRFAHYTPCFRRLHRQCFGDCIACANKSRINRYVKTITKCVVLLIVDAINKFDGETYCKMLCLYQSVFLVFKKKTSYLCLKDFKTTLTYDFFHYL